ncbi:MAG: hypothetical protein EXQ47_04320 [Bryobacterales bacterium]|nr:hypothetical protein [Bryobacterales bacterium]
MTNVTLNRTDVSTMETILRMVERKYGKARRIWVFDRGIVSEENLAVIRKRDGRYPVHRSRVVTGFVQSTAGRLRIFLLPGYLPEREGERRRLLDGVQIRHEAGFQPMAGFIGAHGAGALYFWRANKRRQAFTLLE